MTAWTVTWLGIGVVALADVAFTLAVGEWLYLTGEDSSAAY